MKTSLIVSTVALAAGHMIVASGMAAPARADLVRVQAVQPSGAVQNRMARLWQHRAILENALQPAARAAPAEPLEPQARALRPPEPMVVTAPSPPQSADEGHGQMTCEDAARIVSDFGFSDIGSQQCSGDLYRFSAMRDGTAYDIGISAVTGEIAEVSRQ